MKTGRKVERYESGAVEVRWLDHWNALDLYKWTPAPTRAENYIIDSPPPTVSGDLHLGHVFSYVHQDLVARFKRMRGLAVCYPMGWDDNGLPTERRVQKYYNVRCNPALPYVSDFKPKNDKKNVEEISRRNFVELCIERTLEDEEVFKGLWKKLGLSIDWSQEYSTISPACQRINQISFLRLNKAGKIYQTEAPTIWDVDFQTAIAQAEIEDREVSSIGIDMAFAVDAMEPLDIYTTRPELLAACVAVLVHPEDTRFTAYQGKTAVTPLFTVPVPILTDQGVDMEKGTGSVMVCTFGDITDVEWWRIHNLPLRPVVDKRGHMAEVTFGSGNWPSRDCARAQANWDKLQGVFAVKARKLSIEMLREEGAVVGETKQISHAVKFFEKGEKPLEILTTRQWFVNLQDYKEEFKRTGNQVRWLPKSMQNRFENWVDNLAQDWCISRQRYFGVPFPVWYKLDDDGEVLWDEPIMADEAALPVDPMIDVPPGYDNTQRDQPDGFTGSRDVQDTWSTSAMSPQIVSGWPDDMERHVHMFPSDLRPQGHDIIRTWAFYTIVASLFHHDTAPWHNILINGWILDVKGEKMSKSKNNVTTPNDLMDEYPSDAIRFWAAKARAGVDTALDPAMFAVGRRLINKIFNAGRFVLITVGDTGAAMHGAISHPVDQAFLAKLQAMVAGATAQYDDYGWTDALNQIERFFWEEFCGDYLEFVKERVQTEGSGAVSAGATLARAYHILLRLFAPYVPFVAEEMWQRGYAWAGTSVHSQTWPGEADFAAVPLSAHPESFSQAQVIAAATRKARSVAKVFKSYPIKSVDIVAPKDQHSSLCAALADLIQVERIGSVKLSAGEGLEISAEIVAAGAETEEVEANQG